MSRTNKKLNWILSIAIFIFLALTIFLLTQIFFLKETLHQKQSTLSELTISMNQNSLDALNQEKESLVNLDATLVETKQALTTATIQLEQDILSGKSNKKIAYLTFDDGPYDKTAEYLDLLDEEHVLATFFVLKKDGYDDTYKRIVNSGHTLANHTAHHNLNSGLYSSVDNVIGQVVELETFLFELTGTKTNIFRFPGGMESSGDLFDGISSDLHSKGYKYVDWTAMTGDGSTLQLQEKDVFQWFTASIDTNIEVVLMHDYSNYTLPRLKEMVQYLKDQGYILLPLVYESSTLS